MAFDKNQVIISGIVAEIEPTERTEKGTRLKTIVVRCSGGNRADEIGVKLWGKDNDPTCPVMAAETLQQGDTVFVVGKFSPGKPREHNGRKFRDGEVIAFEVYRGGIQAPAPQQYAPPPAYQQPPAQQYAPPPQQQYQHPPAQYAQQYHQQPPPQHPPAQYPPAYGQADYQ